MARILGIDQSYTSCALVLSEGGVVERFDRFRSDTTADMYSRALHVALCISGFCLLYKPSEVKIEGLAFGIAGNATRDLAGLLFTIINVLKLNLPELKVSVVAPTQVKKRATGSGKAKKPEMIEALPVQASELFKLAGFKKTTGLSDLADAYWISQT